MRVQEVYFTRGLMLVRGSATPYLGG